MEINDGGPAFPVGGPLFHGWRLDGIYGTSNGMSLRDYFGQQYTCLTTQEGSE